MKILFLIAVVLQTAQASVAQTVAPKKYHDNLQLKSGIPLFEKELNPTEAGDRRTFKKQPNKKTKWLVLGGAGLWVTTYLVFDEPLQNFAQNSRGKVSNDVFKTIEPLGRTKYLMPAAGASLLGGLLFKNKRMRDAGVISIASLLANCVITQTLKDGFRRHRPSVSEESDQFDGPFIDTKNSALPSSHTSNAFALATSVAYVYKDVKFVPPLAYGLATLVGISRIHDNAHWTTDVAAGAAVGYLTAKGVIHLHKWIDGKIKKKQKVKLTVAPIITQHTFGLNSTITF